MVRGGASVMADDIPIPLNFVDDAIATFIVVIAAASLIRGEGLTFILVVAVRRIGPRRGRIAGGCSTSDAAVTFSRWG